MLVAVTPRAGDPHDLENAILTVRRTAIDGEVADRVAGARSSRSTRRAATLPRNAVAAAQ